MVYQFLRTRWVYERLTMPKRYHQSHRMHSDADYSDYDKRRMMERRDANMIHEDHAAPANLPQQPVMKYWHENRNYLPEVLDDTIRGIDSQIASDDRERSGGMRPHKF